MLHLGPCLVQSDRTIIVDGRHPDSREAYRILAAYAEPDLCPGELRVSIYRLTPLSLWTAAATGWNAESVLGSLADLSGREIPPAASEFIKRQISRYGRLRMIRQEELPTLTESGAAGRLVLEADTPELLDELAGALAAEGFRRCGERRMTGEAGARGSVKQALLALGYPVLDQAGYQNGRTLPIAWRGLKEAGNAWRGPDGIGDGMAGFSLRGYQQEAVSRFLGLSGNGSSINGTGTSGRNGIDERRGSGTGGSNGVVQRSGVSAADGIIEAGRAGSNNGEWSGLAGYGADEGGGPARCVADEGSGIIVLPCGAGKTVVGLAAILELQCETLILTSSSMSVSQWIRELLSRTTLTPESVGEYAGERTRTKPVTAATYQMLTHRSAKDGGFTHMGIFKERDWGLIIYDEVHLLPAPVFRLAAELQATRRLGLTATLVREDGREGDVFSLIGPKRYELPWKTLEAQGWLAEVSCTEVAVPLPTGLRRRYLYAPPKEKFRIASDNPAKDFIVGKLLDQHKNERILVIGQYLDQLERLADMLQAPLITGRLSQRRRRELYDAFNEGRIQVLVVSKVANFAVDLPDASVGIEVSGAFGSRQEEAQRLGRLLRPKTGANRAYFYTVVTADSREQEFSAKRRQFLTDQGYAYTLIDACGEDFMEKTDLIRVRAGGSEE